MQWIKTFGVLSLTVAVAACGSSGRNAPANTSGAQEYSTVRDSKTDEIGNPNRQTVWNGFGSKKAEQTVQVNRYLWTAALDVLEFLPVQSVDPFTGVIVTGFGTPPGGGRAYRATIHVDDPALEARSLNLALQTKSGPASAETTRAVEDAILARARQLRIADKKL